MRDPYPEKMTVGIIGYGRFGKLLGGILADTFAIRPYDAGFSTGHSLQEAASSDALFLAVPIVALESAIEMIRPFVGPETQILDVCSVKLHAEALLTRHFPSENVLPTHPMFGPDAAKGGLKGLPMALCPTAGTRPSLVAFWSAFFETQGLDVQIMSCDAHDRITAHSLCLTQFLGRALGQMGLHPSNIDTANFKALLSIRDMAVNDSYQLFEGLQRFNPYAETMRESLIASLGETHKKLETS